MHLTPLRLTTQYYINNFRPKNGRRPTRRPFPFVSSLPLALRNHVSGKSDKETNFACLQEMSIVFACMKQNDFLEGACSKEIQSFQSCHNNYLKTQLMKKEQEKQGLLVPGAKKLSHKHLNHLLKQYPQPK